MANKNQTGFFPVGTLSGSPWSASVRRFVANVTGANICIGELVELDALGKAKVCTASSSNIIGSVVGVEKVTRSTTSVSASSLTLENPYHAADTTGTLYVRVVTDPMTIYKTVTGNVTGTPAVTAANIGENFHILTTAGGQQQPAKYQNGAAVLDLGDPKVSVASQLVLLDIPEQADNTAAAAEANTAVLVVLNDSLLHTKKATAG